ncbi:hypothetical protein BDR05DRAFT_1059444 [Suillus weaverae]|nr:hypothetical protein BDR05DRAFT_1059444 [Suillus weaverae]
MIPNCEVQTGRRTLCLFKLRQALDPVTVRTQKHIDKTPPDAVIKSPLDYRMTSTREHTKPSPSQNSKASTPLCKLLIPLQPDSPYHAADFNPRLTHHGRHFRHDPRDAGVPPRLACECASPSLSVGKNCIPGVRQGKSGVSRLEGGREGARKGFVCYTIGFQREALGTMKFQNK